MFNEKQEDWIIFIVDKGCYRGYIQNWIKNDQEAKSVFHGFNEDSISKGIDNMIKKGVLTEGTVGDDEGWIVVTEFMPNTAKSMTIEEEEIDEAEYLAKIEEYLANSSKLYYSEIDENIEIKIL